MSEGRRDEIEAGLSAVRARIDSACSDAGRSATDITLVVVTKFFPASDVRLLADLGVRNVGENRHQEAVEKAAECADLDLDWHFIGALQSNKAAAVAGYADAVHSVDRAKLLGGLSRGAEERGREIDCLVQVSLDPPEASGRSGAAVEQVPELAEKILADRRAAAARCDGGRSARRRCRRSLRPACRSGVRRTAAGAGGDLDLGRHESRPGGGDPARCDTPADRLSGPRSEAGRQVVSEVPLNHQLERQTSATRAEEINE